MDIHFIVRKGEILPHVESFYIKRQETPCPPEIISLLVHKINVDFSKNDSIREFDFPFPSCPTHVTLHVAPCDTPA